MNTKDIIKNCDIVLAEVSLPATGLGIELGRASTYSIPIVCISKVGVKISDSLKFITKNFIEYSNSEDLIEKIHTFLEDIESTKESNVNEK